MTENVEPEKVGALVRSLGAVVDLGRATGMSDLEVGAALGIALAKIGGSAENIRNIAAFACSQIPGENSNIHPFPIPTKPK